MEFELPQKAQLQQAFADHIRRLCRERVKILCYVGIVLIPLSPATLDRKEVARVERDLEVADTDAWRAELDAREWSRRLGG